MKKIDPQNKTCIYLDQFVVSNLIDQTNDTWKEIRNMLEFNFSINLLYCPLSHQHILETAKKEINNAVIHDEYFRKLSDNYIFKNEIFLTSQLISSLIRGNRHTINTYLETGPFKNLNECYSQINDVNKVFNESINYHILSQNAIRKITDGKAEKKIENKFIEVIKNLEIENFIERLDFCITEKQIYIRPDNYGIHEFPNWIDQLLFQLAHRHSFKEIHFKQFLNELKINGFNRIPTLNIRFSLGAYLTVKHKQENVSDHIDIMRITNGLFSSDIFFTDKKRKFEIIDLGLDKLYNTKIYCGVEKDLLDFNCYLQDLK
ncbi:hypothetical protein [Flavobacterium sp. CSZ]|uniref:hypothetical protein n=1 Tax=Flavobacterium sp. CSZ TaxID=2783791 RepID=UPI00188A1404|nr:hypothetical protein [Flavobacterium sp. CSZ]MBF4485775.1 hypothetical protein [Flavobacterium sp. CSZ]